MLRTIEQFDIWLFYLINRSGKNIFFDYFMPFISNERNFFIPIGIAWIYLILKKSAKHRAVAIGIIALIGVSEFLCTDVFKPVFESPAALRSHLRSPPESRSPGFMAHHRRHCGTTGRFVVFTIGACHQHLRRGAVLKLLFSPAVAVFFLHRRGRGLFKSLPGRSLSPGRDGRRCFGHLVRHRIHMGNQQGAANVDHFLQLKTKPDGKHN
jgi:hypothetical protein